MKDDLKENIIILGVLFSGLVILAIFMVIFHYNHPNTDILLLCAFALLLLYVYLVVSYQIETEEKYWKKKD